MVFKKKDCMENSLFFSTYYIFKFKGPIADRAVQTNHASLKYKSR